MKRFSSLDVPRRGASTSRTSAESFGDPGDVARVGFEAMMKGSSDVVAGLKNKLEATAASVVPSEVLANRHRKMA